MPFCDHCSEDGDLGLRDMEYFAQGYIAGKWLRWNSNPGLPVSRLWSPGAVQLLDDSAWGSCDIPVKEYSVDRLWLSLV